MATIEDVARRAGVSRMTVSRVINNSGYTKKETREKVLQAIDELKYRPNLVAKTLVSGRSRTIAYVMVNISDPFHNMVSRGLESVAYKSQYTTMMCDTHLPSRELDYIDMFLNHRLGGAIFHHLAIDRRQADEMLEGGLQMVMIDNENQLEGISAVNTDNHLGGSLAAEYLVSRGHKRIACVHGIFFQPEGDDIPYEDTFQFNIWKQRTAGFADKMKELGIEPAGYFQSNGRFEYANPLTEKFIDEILNMDKRPTALYCENDIMAIAVLNELQKRGLSVPGDMAVIGHDGLEICTMRHPNITTIVQPRYEMGRLAAKMLIDQIEKKTPAQTIVLTPSLLVGETT